MCLVKAAKIVRQELFKTNYYFDGKFDSQVNSIPKSLVLQIRIILDGISAEVSKTMQQIYISLSQLNKFNSIKWKRRKTTLSTRYYHFI